MKLLPLVIRNLTRNRRRTFLTVFSIGVSMFIFAALMSLPGVIDEVLRDRAGSTRLVTHAKGGFAYALPNSYRRRIEGIPHVDAVLGEIIFMGTYRDPRELIPSVAMDPEDIEDIWSDWAITKESAREFRRTRSAALVGATLMRKFGWKIGDNIIIRGTIFPIDVQLTIVGTLAGKSPPAAVIFRRDMLDEALGRPGTVNLFWVKVDRSKNIPQVIAAIDTTFANSSSETKTESELGISRSQMGGMRILIDGTKTLAAIVIFAIGLVAANTAGMAVRERRHEIAVMRAIGFTRARVVAMFVAEGLAIGIAGGLLGCAAAWVTLWFLPYASRTLGLLALVLRLPHAIAAESLAVATLIGLISAAIPSILATRHEISAELRAII